MSISQSAAVSDDKLLAYLDFTLPKAAAGRRGFPKEAMVRVFIVMKCEGFSQITDLADYLANKDVYDGEALIPLNKRDTKNPQKASARVSPRARTARHPMAAETRARSFAVSSGSLKPAAEPITTKTETAAKTRAARNTRRFPMTTDSPLTRNVPDSSGLMPRAECERRDSRFKVSGQERLWARNGKSAADLNALAHISALAAVLAAVQSDPHHSYRSAKPLRRTA